ncbi:probable protein S-acyltransferase 7 [Sesamum indicum]|uniref:S-acyltransferase n=1 Tax=Sesamum indicum TaxID=4182 RepID=A0A6I9T5Q2_SESIN|nr:probable protein S-acyltransferase 7 [Sesamum indicum]
MFSPPLPRHHISHSNKRQIIVDDGPPLRLYQVWKGRNKFIFGGRFIFGPDVRSLFLTLSLILAPVILFWVFVAKGLINAFPHGPGLLVVVLSVIFTAYIIILLLLTSGGDPGIIPRNPHPPEIEDCDISSLSTDWAGSQSSATGLPLTKNVTINGIVVKVKYCQTCMLYRPPRCSHCSICNNCVERFDHHCPWVGQCIGKRNYRYFFMFVSSTTLLCVYVLVLCLLNVKSVMDKNNCSVWRAVEKSPISGILIIYTFVVCWFVGGLTTFHLYLISTNQTTYENFRYQYDRKMNPYNLGFVRNFKEVFCAKIPSSRNNFRAIAKIDSYASIDVSSYLGQTISSEMPNRAFDTETGGKRQTVDADEFEDIRSQVGSFGGLERCGTQRHDWDQRSNWDIMPCDIGNEPCVKHREKINVEH